ncbi:MULTISPECIES: DnaA/Hda family protein [unclassified Brevundimonas]|uniref:DnaA/Hda family protein n=1 Tax=unclassified Brevundimonas TaxID=2622653 RepID=UPI0006F8329E|nr:MULTISPECIES: DnaA/Hda family protein [unclassified Brevundimonas]KQY69799.1 chromosomal replication initiator DnaA [Brevundimonas sp. Root1423]KRA27007.1 chromosomal replication initiator DnaA [Brevundimonas sp. Root608]
MTARPSPADQMRLPLQRDLPEGAQGFVVSDSNRAAVEALADWPSLIGGAMAICGPAGCGKSRLAQIWAERVGAVALHGAEAAVIDPMELEGRPILLDRARDVDDETLFHLINLAQAPGGALLLVARSAPSSWDVALPDLRSRLDAVISVPMEAPDDAVLAAMLEARFAERGIRPQKDVVPYLLRRIDRSAAAAAEVVERLDAMHRPVTRTLARAVVEGTDESGELFE